MPHFVWEKRPNAKASWITADATSKSLRDSKKSLTRKAFDFMYPFHHRGRSTPFARRSSSVLLSSKNDPEPWFSYIEQPDACIAVPATCDTRGKATLKHSISRPFDPRPLSDKTSKLGLRNTKSWMGTLRLRSTQHALDRTTLSESSSIDEPGSLMNCLKINSASRTSPAKSRASPVRIPGRNFVDSGTVRRAKSMSFRANPLDHIYSAPMLDSPLDDLMRLESCLNEMPNPVESPAPMPELQSGRTAKLPEFVFPWSSNEHFTTTAANNESCVSAPMRCGAPSSVPIQHPRGGFESLSIASERSMTVVGSDRMSSGNSDLTQARQRLALKLSDCTQDDQLLSGFNSKTSIQGHQLIKSPPCLKVVVAQPPKIQRRHDSGYNSYRGLPGNGKIMSDDIHELQTVADNLSNEYDIHDSSGRSEVDPQGFKTASEQVHPYPSIEDEFESASSKVRLLRRNRGQGAKMLGKTPSPPISIPRRCQLEDRTDPERVPDSTITDSELADFGSLLFHYPDIDLAFARPRTPQALISECSTIGTEETADDLASAPNNVEDIDRQTPSDSQDCESGSPTKVVFMELTNSIRSRGRQRFRGYRNRSPPILTRPKTPGSSESSCPNNTASVGNYVSSPRPMVQRRSSSID